MRSRIHAPAETPVASSSLTKKVGADVEREAVLQRFSVAFEYSVHFTDGALDPKNRVLAEAIGRLEPAQVHRVVAIIDAGVTSADFDVAAALARYAEAHGNRLAIVGTPGIIPGGERAKTGEAIFRDVLGRIRAGHLDRKSFLIVIGGGAVQDAAGYAAAVAHRGIRVIRMPTTVESQCDSGVGVKNAINAFGTKNYLGTFAPPFAVINDARFLTTLAPRDLRAGMAEAVKVAALRDRAFFEWLCQSADRLACGEMSAICALIRRAAELHLNHISESGDAFEMGTAKPLDHGHWAAHKLESLSDYELRHGEAVAIGMAIDARYAVEKGWLAAQVADRICTLLERLGFALWHRTLADVDAFGRRAVLAGLEEFREHLGGGLALTLLSGIGSAFETHDVEDAALERAIAWLEHRSRGR